MKTSLIALLFLFPNVETVSIQTSHHQTNWTIRYEFKSNDRCFISINTIDCFISGDLLDSTNHDRKVKLKNLNLFLINNEEKFKYTNNVCGSGNHKRFELRIQNEQGENVGELELTRGDRFYIIVSIRHDHKPESDFDILRGYLDIRLKIGHKNFDRHIVLAQQHRIIPPKIKLEPPPPDYLTDIFFRTAPTSIVLSRIIEEYNLNGRYSTNYLDVAPGEKIKIKFYYYLFRQYNSECDFQIRTNSTRATNDLKTTMLLRKFAGWQKHEEIFIVPRDVRRIALIFDIRYGIVFIDDLSVTVLGNDP